MTIAGSGEQPILNDTFYLEPSYVYVNNELDDTCKRTCNLGSDSPNRVTLEFSSEIKSFENMFSYLTNLKSVDLSLFDASEITSMNSMFDHCTNLISVNFGEINTSSVVDMRRLFYFCSSINSIDVSRFDTSSVTNMISMFSECGSLTSIDVSNFDTSNVIEMLDIFAYDRALLSVDTSSFYTPKAWNLQGIFYCCDKLKFVDMHNFDGSLVTNFGYVFGFLGQVKYINLRNFKILANNEDVSLHDTFTEIYYNTKYCIKDEKTKNFLIGNKNNDCSDLCFQKNVKIDFLQATCECNEQYKYEFLVKCYDECPGNTPTFKNNKYICEGPVPENYYLDEDEMYRKCFYTCQKCSESGNEANNNCEKCIDNYKYLNDSLAGPNNCYKQCEYYYFFNETKQYECTETNSCPTNFKNLILPKKKCIDDCKKDDYEEYTYEYNNSCLSQCPENTKLIEEQKLCLDECYPEQFEYNNICYNDCPDGTSKILMNRNRCTETVPENYYLDSTDGINKKCYDLCKKCSQEGNENINNCDECINNYIFLNDSLATLKNCYPKCSQLYYFNEHNQYICIESCPSGYDKLILEKNKCIDDCKKDNEYIYEYDNNCLKECPEDKKVDFDEKKCVQLCQENQFEFDDNCYNEVPKGQDDFNPNGNIFVKNTTNFDNLLTNLLSAQHLSEEGSVITIEREDKMVYEITNTKNELELLKNMSNIPNKTIIDLGECENTLRKHYHINENDSLIIVKANKNPIRHRIKILILMFMNLIIEPN